MLLRNRIFDIISYLYICIYTFVQALASTVFPPPTAAGFGAAAELDACELDPLSPKSILVKYSL